MGLTARAKAKLQLKAQKSSFARDVMLPAGEYISVKEIAGLPLVVAAAVALIWSNSPWGDLYRSIWSMEQEIRVFWFSHTETLRHWVNDALLPLFFFVAGLEIKRELVRGELSTPRKAALPFVLALGGVIVPTGMYLAFNAGGGDTSGWGVPVATDVAFALAVLALFGDRIPSELKVLVLTFAAVDDVFGVLIIAVAYSREIATDAMWFAGLYFGLVVVLRALRIPLYSLFVVVGLPLWYAVLKSGIHPSVMAVALGLLAPARPMFERGEFARVRERANRQFLKTRRELQDLESRDDLTEEEQDRRLELSEREDALVGLLEEQARQTEPITDRLIHGLNPWVSYALLPLFALANAGVVIDVGTLKEVVTSRPTLGIIAGLVIGKPLGLLVFGWIALRLRWAQLPDTVTWTHLVAAGLLAGIGFTVSLFIGELAFGRRGAEIMAAVKVAIFIASLLAAVLGALWLWWRQRSRSAADGNSGT